MSRDRKCNLCDSENCIAIHQSPIKREGNNHYPYLITDSGLRPLDRIFKCADCGLVFAVPAGELKRVHSAYVNMIDERYIEEEQGRRVSACSILIKLDKLKRDRNSSSRLLDIGCGTGILLDEARKMGWETCGVEVSKWAAQYAKEKFNLKIHNTTLEEVKFSACSFDVVIMQDVIEHLVNPRQALTKVRKILKPDGILYINTPDIKSISSRLLKTKWWGMNSFHLYYFSKKSLDRLLVKSGFRAIKYSRYVRTFTVRYWLERFADYNKLIYRFFSFITRINLFGKRLLTVNLYDEVGVFARKKRSLEYFNEFKESVNSTLKENMKTIVVLPAYNAARTLEITFNDIPKDVVSEVILVDDNSKDDTVKIAKRLRVKTFVHKKNRGYGANQKTCYTKALELGADIIVMVHPDYQYDPRVISELINPIKNGQFDAVFGSRMMKGGALIGGMPRWKHNANIILTALENIVFNTFLTEYHSGFRAYSSKFLETVRFNENSDGFIFDTEIIAQALLHNFKIEEVSICTRYFDEASTIKFWPCVFYGLGILKTLLKYILHTHKIKHFKQFE